MLYATILLATTSMHLYGAECGVKVKSLDGDISEGIIEALLNGGNPETLSLMSKKEFQALLNKGELTSRPPFKQNTDGKEKSAQSSTNIQSKQTE